jgi:hypothetical protein
MSRRLLICVASLLLGMHGAVALEEKTFGTIRYLAGGVGEDEKEEITRRQKDYSLRILTAQRGSGNFIADAQVTILRGRDQIFTAVMDAPYLLVALDPGTYTVRVEFQGKPQERRVSIRPRGQAQLYLYWD